MRCVVFRFSHAPAISHIRETNEATQELATELGRAPTQTELADFMGKETTEYQKERSHAHQMLMVDSEAAEDEMLNTPQKGLRTRAGSGRRDDDGLVEPGD